MKMVIHKMNCFMDVLYEEESIMTRIMNEWSHKDAPKEYYVLLHEEDYSPVMVLDTSMRLFEHLVDAMAEYREYMA